MEDIEDMIDETIEQARSKFWQEVIRGVGDQAFTREPKGTKKMFQVFGVIEENQKAKNQSAALRTPSVKHS